MASVADAQQQQTAPQDAVAPRHVAAKAAAEGAVAPSCCVSGGALPHNTERGGDAGARLAQKPRRSVWYDICEHTAWPSLISSIVCLGVTVAVQPQSRRWPLTPENQAAMFSYPEVHSTVPGWLLTVISIAMIAYAAVAELFHAWAAASMRKRARLLLAAAVVVDACEAVAWSIFMTMWLKRYTGVPRPNFAATCRGVATSDGQHIHCSSTHRPTGPDSSRQAFPSGHASIMGALGVFVSAHLVTRFACAYCPAQPASGGACLVPAPARLLEQKSNWRSSLRRTMRCIASSTLVMPACIAPLVLALWVSASRIHDYAHSAGDVTGGLLLGGAFGALLLMRTHALDVRLHREAAAQRAAAGA